jgi:osmotically-inducible protein OsmY
VLETRGIKRVPVLRDGVVVGIVSRSNLLRAFASLTATPHPATIDSDDAKIRAALTNELGRRWAAWPAGANFIVQNGEVHLWGLISSEAERRAMVMAAEAVPGVKRVEDHLGYPGLVF